MKLRELCTELGVKLEPIAKTTGYSLPYVAMCVNGDRNNSTIISEVHRQMEIRKDYLRDIIQ
tara:strand:- start:237 stop:422 length:186 start_codon:yes stop_codon:yes gene_type:complete